MSRPQKRKKSGAGRRLGAALAVAKGLIPPPIRPRLGRLEAQHRPRPLTVPRRYLGVTAPSSPPLISIVTPTLNQGRFIRATFASVVAQNYPRLEYVVADGGSEDGTLDAVAEYRDHIDHFEPGPDDGQIDAINRTLDRANGEIVAWLNSDDLLLPGALACVARFFAEHPEVDLVYGHRVLINEDSDEIGLWALPSHTDDALRWEDLVPQETAFWRRDLWHRLGGLSTEFAVAFDWDFFSRASAGGARIVRLPRFLGAQRQHPEQKARLHEAVTRVEQTAIRERWAGHPVGEEEIRAGVFIHLLRSLPHQYWHALRSRIALGRVVVNLPSTATEPMVE